DGELFREVSSLLANHGDDGDFESWAPAAAAQLVVERSEEHTSELQSHRDLHSFPTRRSSDLTASYFAKSRPCSRITETTGISSRGLQRLRRNWSSRDRKSTRLNSSPTEISTLSLHDALPI